MGFLPRALAWFAGQGISCMRVLSVNGSAYRSKPWREAYSALGLTPKHTRPYTPRTNGKAERFIKTLLAEWAYSMAFNETTGCLAIWRSITAAGVIWLWLAVPPFSSSDCCGLLNDLVRKHS